MAGSDEVRVPVKAPEERAVRLSSEAPGSPLVLERPMRIGPLGLYGVVDEPLAPTTAPWVVLVNVAAEHHIGPGRRWVEWARRWAGDGYRVIRIDQTGVGDSPVHEGQVEDEMFAPEWIGDMREVVQTLSADGAPVVVVGLCSGSYSAFEVALWEKVEAVFAVNPRVTLFQAAKGSHVHTSIRRAGIVPAKPLAALAKRQRIVAGGIWRIYRQLAVWHGPFRVLRSVVKRGTAVHVERVPGRRPALHRGAVLAAVHGAPAPEPAVHVRAGRDLRPLAAEQGRPAGHLRARVGVPGEVRRPARRGPRGGGVVISLLGLDPATYRRHALHDGERTYQETNCYADCLIELVAPAGHEPEAMLAGTAAVDFEVDQWTFFKPAPEDLLALYGLDLHEMQPYRSLAEQAATRLAVGQSVIPEVDSFYLPDVVATDYRQHHVKSSLVVEAIDLDAKVLRYFHNAGYFELSGDDFDGLFGPPQRTAAVRRAGPVRRRARALRAGAARGRPRAARQLPGPAPARQPLPAVPRRARGRPAAAARRRRGRLPRLRLPQPADGGRLVRAARQPRALAAGRGR